MKRVGFIAGSRIKKWEDWEPSLVDTLYEQDDFLGDILKDEWDVNVGAGCTVAIVAALRGTVALTTVAGDNLFANLAGELNLNALLSAGIEARVALDFITLCTIEVGLVDAKTYANGRAFDDYELTGGLPTPICVNGAIVGFDPTDSPLHPHLTGVSAIAGVGTVNNLGVDPVAGAFIRLGVRLDVAGNAHYYVNGALLGTQLLAITPATPLAPWLAISNKAGAIARVHTVDYVKFWQNR